MILNENHSHYTRFLGALVSLPVSVSGGRSVRSCDGSARVFAVVDEATRQREWFDAEYSAFRHWRTGIDCSFSAEYGVGFARRVRRYRSI